MLTYINRTQIIDALRRCGVKKNDSIMVHTNISKVGKLKGTLKQQLGIYLEAIKNVVGNKGTIVVPAYNYEYAEKKKPFNVEISPLEKYLGLFPNFFFKQKNVVRSLNPLTSVAAIGKKAKYICGGNTATGYGVDSPFDRLTKLKAKMIFMGVDCTAMSYVHYVEQTVGVPYLYFKLFLTPIYHKKKKINLPVCNQVRYLDCNVIYDKEGNTRKFEKAKLVRKAKIGNGYIRVVSFEEAFNFLKKNLQKNFFYLLKEKPKFKKNSIPLI